MELPEGITDITWHNTRRVKREAHILDKFTISNKLKSGAIDAHDRRIWNNIPLPTTSTKIENLRFQYVDLESRDQSKLTKFVNKKLQAKSGCGD